MKATSWKTTWFFSTARLSKTSAGMYLGVMSIPWRGLHPDIREQSHLELKAQNIHTGDVFLAAFQDHFFFYKCVTGRLIGPTDTNRPAFLP